MGAQQSAPQGEAGRGAAVPAKTCYYEVLGIDRQATDDEIKKAYRRKALELHPDRNYGDTENATRRFAEVSTAYEVLSDTQERAWYDSHREAILRGHDPEDGELHEFNNVRLTTTDDIYTLIRRFNASVPFNDEPTGFYGIVRETFEHLAAEEAAAADYAGRDPVDYPTFGSSDDDYETVVKVFYKGWSGFSTRKTFSWKDKYRLSDAPDRQIRRMMEKDNKKCRDDAVNEFNDAVRFLLGFVRKRDPRYVPNTQTDADRQKALRDAAAARSARDRAANREKLAGVKVAEWARSRSDEDIDDEDFSELDEESEVEHFECVVCDKVFKSEKQVEAHEKSKKHVKAVQQLRRQMKKENNGLDLNGEVSAGQAQPVQHRDSGGSDSEELQVDAPAVETLSLGEENGAETIKSRRAAATLDESAKSPETSETDDDDEYAPRSKVEQRLTGTSVPDQDDDHSKTGIASGAESNDDSKAPQTKKIGKAKARREKKAAREAADSQEQVTNKCAVCQETFPSRTRLFSHIRAEGHEGLKTAKGAKGRKR